VFKTIKPPTAFAEITSVVYLEAGGLILNHIRREGLAKRYMMYHLNTLTAEETDF